MIDHSPSIFINKIRVSTKKHLALKLDHLDKGINVIRGDNSSGRTTFLKLLEFALGNPSLQKKDFIPEVLKCENVAIEVQLNEVVYTFERSFRRSGQISVYRGTIDEYPLPYPATFTPGSDISNFILGKLNIPQVSVVDEFTGIEKAITFFDIFSMVYLDQDMGLSKIHARLNQTQHKNTFRLLSQISSIDLYELTLEEQTIKKRRQELLTDFQAIEKFLGEVRLPMLTEIQSGVESLQQQKKLLQDNLAIIRHQVRSQPKYNEPLRNEILTIENDLGQQRQELYYAQQTLRSYYELENQLLADLDKSERVQSSNYILLSFEFEQCPRCLQDVTENMKIRENHGECCLCGRNLLKNEDNASDLDDYQRQINSQLEELSQLQQQYKIKIERLEEKINSLVLDLDKRRQMLDNHVMEYVSPAIRNIEVVAHEISRIDTELDSLEQKKSWRLQIYKMQESLQKSENDLKEIQERQQQLKGEERNSEEKLIAFEGFLREFLVSTFPEPLNSVRLNRKNFLPFVNRHPYTAKSTTIKNLVIIGYYYAQLRFALEISSHFPRFLVIDTLRQDDLERTTYEKVLSKFKELEGKYDHQFQIILVIRDQFDVLAKNEKIQLVHGKLLLDIQ